AEELPAAVLAAEQLDPEDCVAHVAENFSVERMAEDYVEVYRRFAAGRYDVHESARVSAR
ncbi:glycosyltransferase family 4 protein, partial [Micromonospora sp. WMMD964]